VTLQYTVQVGFTQVRISPVLSKYTLCNWWYYYRNFFVGMFTH